MKGEDPIKKYPDRKASHIENSNYMSQLASGFQEVVEQNDKVMKEKTKGLLLQEMASGGAVSHQSFRSLSSLGMNNLMAGARPFFLPSNTPHQYQIGSPRSQASTTSAQRQFRAQVFGTDIDPEFLRESLQNQMDIDEDIKREEEKRQAVVASTRTTLNQAYRTSISRLLPPSAGDEMANVDFSGVFGNNQFKVEVKDEKKVKGEKKVKNDKKTSVKKTVKKDKPEPDKEPALPRGRPKGSKKPQESDDEVEVTKINLNENKTMAYWKAQSAKEIRNQLKLRNIPSSGDWMYKKNLLKIVSKLIQDKKW